MSEKAWWEHGEPAHGEKFIEVPCALITEFDKYNAQHMPLSEALPVKQDTLKNTLWAIEYDMNKNPSRYWQYSKKYNISPVAFDLREVKLQDKDGHPIV